MNMEKWLKEIQINQNKKAMPILTFPAIQLLGCSVKDLINGSDLQAKAMKSIVDQFDPLASLGLMDLSVEAECFGSTVRFSDEEVPTVVGSVVTSMEEANDLVVPKVGQGRTQIYLDAIEKVTKMVTDRPVFAGAIGPFSLAGRLMDVSEAMIYCYDDPDMVHVVLEKVTKFIIDYILEYKAIGANGVVMAEPLAGILSPSLIKEFSCDYVKRIIEAVEDENFIVIYHNCGNNVNKMINELLEMNAKAYHFGNAIDIHDMLSRMPKDKIIMGNLNPVVEFKTSTLEEVASKTIELLEENIEYSNYIISSGCDIPPMSSLENIAVFMNTSKAFYENHS